MKWATFWQDKNADIKYGKWHTKKISEDFVKPHKVFPNFFLFKKKDEIGLVHNKFYLYKNGISLIEKRKIYFAERDGHTMTKFLILSGPNSTPTRKYFLDLEIKA